MSNKRNPDPRPVALPSIHEKLAMAQSACSYWYEIKSDPAWSSGKITALQQIITEAQTKINHIQDQIQRAPAELEKYQKLVADLEARGAEERKVKAIPKIQKTMTSFKKNLAFLEELPEADLMKVGITQEQLDKMRALIKNVKV